MSGKHGARTVEGTVSGVRMGDSVRDINNVVLSKYIKGEGRSLIMSNGSSVDVSRSKKEQLMKKLQPGR